MRGESRPCPVCSGEGARAIADALPVPVVECTRCGFAFIREQETDRVPSNPKPRRKYRSGQVYIKAVCDKLSVGDRTRPISVLEIGCGSGALASLFQADARYRYRGFEPSAARAAFCQNNGLDVVHGHFTGQHVAEFDFVIMDNVLEHVAAPAPLVAAAADALVPGGRLICIVPGRNDIRRFMPAWKRRHYWQRAHINYFDRSSLGILFERAGLQLDDMPVVWSARRVLVPHLVQGLMDSVGIRILGLYGIGRKGPTLDSLSPDR